MPEKLSQNSPLSQSERSSLHQLLIENMVKRGITTLEAQAKIYNSKITTFKRYRPDNPVPVERLFLVLEKLGLDAFRSDQGVLNLKASNEIPLHQLHPISYLGTDAARAKDPINRGIHYLIYYRKGGTSGDHVDPLEALHLPDTLVTTAHLVLQPLPPDPSSSDIRGNVFIAHYKLTAAVSSTTTVTSQGLEAARTLLWEGHYVWKRKKHVYIRIQPDRGDSPQDFTKEICLNFPESEDSYQRSQEIIGTFTSFEPACGLAYLQRVNVGNSMAGLAPLLDDRPIQPFIVRLLAGRNFNRFTSPALFDPNSYRRIIDDVAPYVGRYVGYYMRKRDKSIVIRQIPFEIYDGFKIKYHSHDKNGAVHYGYIADFTANKLYCCLRRDERFGHHMIHLSLKTDNHAIGKQKSKFEQVLVGIHGGLRGDGTGPDAGRVILLKQRNSGGDFSTLEGREYNFDDTEAVQSLLEGNPILARFFAGNLDDFLDCIVPATNRLLLRKRFEYLGDGIPNPRSAGYYLTFRKSTREPVVYQRCVRVSKNGSAERYLGFDEGWQTVLSGEITKKEGLPLRFNFYRQKHRESPMSEWTYEWTSRTTLISGVGAWRSVGVRKLDYENSCRIGHTTRTAPNNVVTSFKEYFIFLGNHQPGEFGLAQTQNYTRNHLPEIPFLKKIVRYLLNNNSAASATSKSRTTMRSNSNNLFD